MPIHAAAPVVSLAFGPAVLSPTPHRSSLVTASCRTSLPPAAVRCTTTTTTTAPAAVATTAATATATAASPRQPNAAGQNHLLNRIANSTISPAVPATSAAAASAAASTAAAGRGHHASCPSPQAPGHADGLDNPKKCTGHRGPRDTQPQHQPEEHPNHPQSLFGNLHGYPATSESSAAVTSARAATIALVGGERGTRSPSADRNQQAQSTTHRSIASLHEVTERIADLLQVGMLQDVANHDLLCPKDGPVGLTPAGTPRHHIVIVFGKRLIGDKLTVEYAKRIVTLVKQIVKGGIAPDTICFTGGRRPGPSKSNRSGVVSEALAGYMFFLSVCEEIGVDASRFDYILEENSTTTVENVANTLREVRSKFGADALAKCHFTFISSDYHLIRIQEVHRISPRHSLLFPLEVANATWNCIFAAYPFSVSSDPATAFLGRAVVLANDLNIVLVNLSSVLKDRQFLARDNLARLNDTFAKMRDMFRVVDPSRKISHSGFRIDMRVHSETLELAIHRVREVHTLLGPLSDPCCSIPREDLQKAHALLRDAVSEMRNTLDPDRPLKLSDYAESLEELQSLIDELTSSDPKGSVIDTKSVIGLKWQNPADSSASNIRNSVLSGNTRRPLKRIGRDGPNVVVMEGDSSLSHKLNPDFEDLSVRDVDFTSLSSSSEESGQIRTLQPASSSPERESASAFKARPPTATPARRKSATKRPGPAKTKSKVSPSAPQA